MKVGVDQPEFSVPGPWVAPFRIMILCVGTRRVYLVPRYQLLDFLILNSEL